MTRPSRRFHSFRLLLALLACAATGGCGAGWHLLEEPEPATLPARQQVQVWLDQRIVRLHRVVLTQDSVTGIPFLQPADCDSCRVGFARTQVDSVRLGEHQAGFLGTVSLMLAGLLLIGLFTGRFFG